MIDRKLATELLSEFGGMRGTPEDDSDMERRLKAMMMHPRSESHARAVVSKLLGTLRFFPAVADIIQAAADVLDPQSAAAISQSRNCRFCRGDGWITQEGPFGIEVAYPCDHTGRIPDRLGVTIPASIQRQYARESVEAEKRREDWQKLPKKERERIQAMNADGGGTA